MPKDLKEEPKIAPAPPAKKYQYLCPACTNVAIETSNKMLNVQVDCKACGATIKLDNPQNYKEI